MTKSCEHSTALSILHEAQKLIRPRGAWTQNAYARTKAGEAVLISASDASCFCTIGAIAKVLGYHNGPSVLDDHPVVELLCKALNSPRQDVGAVMIFNDARKTRKKDVLALFDRAIELAA